MTSLKTRKYSSPRILGCRPMTEADLESLRLPPQRHDRVKNLRDSHHNVARLMASGMSNTEIALATGYTTQRIGRFRNDPSMVELVASYRAMITEDWLENQDHLAVLAVKNMVAAERQLSDKLDAADEAGELLPTRELLAIAADRMDRFGYGKKSMNVNVNVDFAAKLEAAIARSKKVTAE